MREIVNRRSRCVHRRLVDQMYVTEELGVAGNRERQRLDAPEERHARRPVLLDHVDHGLRQWLDRLVIRLGHIPKLQIDSGLHRHSTTLLICFRTTGKPAECRCLASWWADQPGAT